jgi:hypothetical protein
MVISGRSRYWARSNALLLLSLILAADQASAQASRSESMSSTGAMAAEAVARITGGLRTIDAPTGERDDDLCQNDPRCPGGHRENAVDSTQSELSIAMDRTGRNVVVGFNDFRGFSGPATSPLSISGYMYSTDGGHTFTDGGQLPVTTGTEMLGNTLLPQIFGDPDVKYLGGCTFIYSSIVVKKFSATAAVQTMGVHRSVDCGRTWQGPYEVAAATSPNGLLSPAGAPLEAADKEFIDVDPDTGRIMMSWSNFTPTSIEIRSAVSDDGGLTWPRAMGRLVSATPADGQASIPRFARDSSNVYIAWRRFTGLFGYGNTTAFARSTDNGLTWEPPIELSPPFLTQDLILGNDRSNTSPSMAVDRTNGRRKGSIYIVYPNNNNGDGSDIVFQKSTDGGATFSPPVRLNSRPGGDRAQWFPWVTVDEITGRVSVFYYDQGIATSGHLSEVSYLFSNDGGDSWEHPRPITPRPMKAGHGNDTGQPNLGDYNQAVARAGRVLFAYALASPPPLGFTDGQPSTQMTVPDATVKVFTAVDHVVPHASVSLQGPSTSVAGGHADPGETISLRLPLFNYATNALYAEGMSFALGFLSSPTPGVVVTSPLASYSGIPPGETRANARPYRVRLLETFVPGTPIELELGVLTNRGFAELRHTLFTGTPQETIVLQQNFDGVAPGTLPAGWTAAHGGGSTTVPWTTSNTFCGPSNGAFHPNQSGTTRWERLFSPPFGVPADAEYVVVEFDVCYDTEDDLVLSTTAYDGFFLRVTDLTTGRTLRSVLAEAFEEEFTTGDINHYPKHLPRSSNPAYFEDMSVWAGQSNGRRHVRLRLPGMAGSTAQLRFEYTEDSIFSCLDVRPGSLQCGVLIDNLVVKSVVSQKPAAAAPSGP